MPELETAGCDPSRDFEEVECREYVLEVEDARPARVLNGAVTNLSSFGAFRDIGVHQEGRVRVSRLANHCVRNAAEGLRPAQG